MKGTVNVAELAAAVKTAQSIIATGIKIDSLKHVRLTASGGELEVEATNLDQHMAVRLPAKLSDGVAIVDPARLLMTLAPISGEVTLSCAENFMSVSGKGSRSKLALLPNDLWANVEKPAAEAGFDVDGESLVAAFDTILPAVADDASRFYLNGAHLKWAETKLIAEASNGVLVLTREIVARRPALWPKDSVIVPREFVIAAGRIMKGDSATLSISVSRVVLTTSVGWLASKLIAGTFPDIERAWDKKAVPALRADRKSLLGVIKLAHQFSEADGHSQRTVVVHNGEALAAGPNGEMFRACFDGEYIKEQSYSFQPRVLLSALSALTSETVELTDGGSRPDVIVIHGDGARTCVAMQIAPPGWFRREKAEQEAEAA